MVTKVKTVVANNRKKAFEIEAGAQTFEFPYSRLRLIPTLKDPVASVASDPEIGKRGFTYRLSSGHEDTVLLDQVLDYARDPLYLRHRLLFKLSIEAQKRVRELGVPKREIIRRMGTTPTQFYRLMDQKNVKKTLEQMLKLLAALDCSVDFVIKRSA